MAVIAAQERGAAIPKDRYGYEDDQVYGHGQDHEHDNVYGYIFAACEETQR